MKRMFLKEKVKFLIWHNMLKIKLKKNGGRLGKALFCKNARYIRVAEKVRIKDGYRIECYESFGGGNLNLS